MYRGSLCKLKVVAYPDTPAQYTLSLGPDELALNPLLGKTLHLSFEGHIACIRCGKSLRKSFAQGFCYTCFRSIPELDLCSVRPETCHFSKGTCRDPEWGRAHCFITHTVYLANSSGLKVGITRTHLEQTRWLDQGARQALPLLRVSKRIDAGIVESALRQHVGDRTNWRKLLKADAEPLDLLAKRDELLNSLPSRVAYRVAHDEAVRNFTYPLLAYPKKPVPLDLHKTSQYEGILLGIKGQYLLFENAVLNVRKFTGYSVALNFKS